MYYWDLARYLTRWFRGKRYRNFTTVFPPERCKRIVDLGGSAEIWEMMKYPADITLLNISKGWLTLPRRSLATYVAVVGDGRKTDYPDGHFDLAFSNSVIEHVGTADDAAQFASELQRIGNAYYCQTPNKWFPIEPHLGTLFLHWKPALLENYFVLRYLTLWGLMHKPDRATAKLAARDARLLTRKELAKLFPGAEIVTERIAFLPKSYAAMRRPGMVSRTAQANECFASDTGFGHLGQETFMNGQRQS
jgi:Methyltransferase domain